MHYHAIDLSKISGIFWLWAIVNLLALVTFLIELMIRPQNHDESDTKPRIVWEFTVQNKIQQQWLEETFKNVQKQFELLS